MVRLQQCLPTDQGEGGDDEGAGEGGGEGEGAGAGEDLWFRVPI